jgi:phospholipid/cholesterol/gamma-HCH transport system substrate-binding protein
MGNSVKNMLIGVFIIAACSLLIGIVMFLKPSVGDGKKILYVRFANINKIGIGTRVTYAGRPVGEVVAIDEIYHARSQPVDTEGRFYFYQLTLKVDSSVVVYNTDDISLQTSGLLGEKSVAIIPVRPPKGMTPKLITNQPIYASSVDPLDKVMDELSAVSNKLGDTLDQVTKWLKQYGDDIGCAVKTFTSALHQADVMISNVNEQNLIQAFKETTCDLKATVTKIHDILCEMDDNQTFTNLAATAKNLKQATGSIEVITQDIADGKGTIGKLLKSEDLYLRFTAIMSKVDMLMNDINQYGMLFHLNKSWQRTHLKQVNLMNSLNTPDSFKSYFEKEVDQVNTSMERISMLLDRAEQSPEKEQILQNDIFKKDFAELLRKADELADNLRLYNQQLMELQSSN